MGCVFSLKSAVLLVAVMGSLAKGSTILSDLQAAYHEPDLVSDSVDVIQLLPFDYSFEDVDLQSAPMHDAVYSFSPSVASSHVFGSDLIPVDWHNPIPRRPRGPGDTIPEPSSLALAALAAAVTLALRRLQRKHIR